MSLALKQRNLLTTLYLVSERKIGIFSKIKEGENYNHRKPLKYFEDYNLSLTKRLGKITIFGRALLSAAGRPHIVANVYQALQNFIT
jgi:hypothetical protein